MFSRWGFLSVVSAARYDRTAAILSAAIGVFVQRGGMAPISLPMTRHPVMYRSQGINVICL